MSKQKPIEDKANYDICIHGNDLNAFQKASNKAIAGAHVALVHDKDKNDKDFSPKEDIIIQALHASAKTLHNANIANKVGLPSSKPEIHWKHIQAHIQGCLDRVAPHYSIEKLKAHGVHVMRGPLQDETISAKETILFEENTSKAIDYEDFDKTEPLQLLDITTWEKLPEHLIILGSCGNTVSLAQSLLRLGCKTTIVNDSEILSGLDRELYDGLFQRFEYEGIRLIQNAEIQKIDTAEKIIIHMVHKEAKRRVSGTHILVIPNSVDADIFALSDPAIAQTGLTEDAAREKFGAGNFHLIKWRYQECDFANSMHKTDGLMKIVTKMDGTVLGSGICGAAANELIMPWSLAINNKLKISDMQNLASSYSSYSRMITLSVEGYMSQLSNPARFFKKGTSFWQGLIGGPT